VMFVRGIDGAFIKQLFCKKRIDHALFIVRLEGSGYFKNGIRFFKLNELRNSIFP